MFVLPDLPYPHDALAPTMSADTLRVHHGKHHAGYVEKTNALAAKAGLAHLRLEDLVREARRRGDHALFNNAAQTWNHAFFWRSMSPRPAPPQVELKSAIDSAFGGMEALRKAFVEEGANHFASGWVWLTAEPGGLKVISTHDADDVFCQEAQCPLITCDVWEHAYYLDYKNDRKAFLERWFDALADWSFAERQLLAAQGRGQPFRFPEQVAA